MRSFGVHDGKQILNLAIFLITIKKRSLNLRHNGFAFQERASRKSEWLNVFFFRSINFRCSHSYRKFITFFHVILG